MRLERYKMIRILFLLLVLLLPAVGSFGQSSDMNYVQTKTFLDENASTFLRHIDYYDELGVVTETVDVGGNTTNTPIKIKTDYNSQLKPIYQWTPVPSIGLDYIDRYGVADAAEEAYGYYDSPYSEYGYDDFLQLTSSTKPGDAWCSHPVTITRNMVPAGVVRKYSVDSNGTLVNDGTYYPYGLLTSATTTDEDGRSMTVFTDFHGNTVLERRGEGNDTYYVYDEYGRLSYVLPPMCQQCDTPVFPKYWYRYKYDDRGRCIWKQLPGCEPIQYWYDNADRIVSEQDGHLREEALQRHFFYDAIGRLTMQTIHSASISHSQATESNAKAVEVKNYYDGYSCCQELAQLFPQWAGTINSNSSSAMVARGKPTATLCHTSDGNSYFELYRYDANGRMSDKISAYADKWMKTSTMTYNFIGDVGTTKESVYTCSNGQLSEIANRRTINQYHAGTRLLKKTTVTHLDQNGTTSTQVISQPTYDVFGNVTANNRPGTAADMTYTYDTLHGWVSGISSPSGFSEELLRETATNAQYSGNIGSIQWQNTINGERHRYDYTYDTLGRLTSAGYSSSGNGTEGRYDESVSYNPNGSIEQLQRYGMKNNGTFGEIDDLTVSYDGNRLLKVTDAAEALNYNGAQDFNDGANADCEYEYDSNGALTYDSNRGITSITYDYGHHPYKISMKAKKKTHYNCYTSDGRKLLSKHEGMIPTGTGYYRRFSTTDLYIDGLILRDGVPYIWQFDGGYVELNANGTPTRWNYYVCDHLGSTRKVVDSNDNVKETVNYYPFGSEMKMQDPAQMAGDTWQPYRFTGKELDQQNSLNWYDFGARWFDVAGVPMWTSVDPLAENYYSISPYTYCENNPVNAIDPDGRAVNFAAAGIGAVVGAGIYATIAYWEGKSPKQILGAAGEGAIVGGVTGLTLGIATSITASSVITDASISAMSSSTGNAANQLISQGEIKGDEVAFSFVAGAASGAMGSVGGKLVNQCKDAAVATIKSETENIIANARNLAYSQVEQTGAQMGGKYAKQQVKKVTSEIIKEANSYASSAVKTVESITAGKKWSVQMGIGTMASKVSDYCDSAKEKLKSLFYKLF